MRNPSAKAGLLVSLLESAMFRMFCVVYLWIALHALASSAEPPRLEPVERLQLPENLTDADNLSGIALLKNDSLAVCTDEVANLQVLSYSGGKLAVVAAPQLGAEGTEIDLEGLAVSGDVLYAVGSHSLARKAADPDKSYQKNRERIREINEDANRDQLFRVKLAADGSLRAKDSINLQAIFRQHSLLRPFSKLPSKENGIDIEGIAAHGDSLYVGFRGPVLRGNYVPVLRLRFDEPNNNELLFVPLDGNGIRDMTAVDDGFLILAGPVGDARGTYAVYHWNGSDCLVGQDGPGGKCELLATIGPLEAGKPEGLAARKSATGHELFLVFDGLSDAVYRYELKR